MWESRHSRHSRHILTPPPWKKVSEIGAPLGRCGEALWPMWFPAGMEGGSVAAISKLPRLPHRAKGLCYIGYRATRHRLQAPPHRPYSSRGNFFALTDPSPYLQGPTSALRQCNLADYYNTILLLITSLAFSIIRPRPLCHGQLS